MVLCPICQDTVKIPIIINVFPCYRPNTIHCFTFIRICLTCVFEYFHLKITSTCRPLSIKCLYCPESCNPQRLTFERNFTYDYFLSEMKPECLPLTCPFCFEHTSSILSHLQSCKYMYYQCDCGDVTFRLLSKYHNRHCPFFKTCEICYENIHQEDYANHLLLQHDHIECELCHEFFHFRDLRNHQLNHCLFRKVQCKFCIKNVWYKDFVEHLQTHEDKLLTSIDNLKSMISNVETMLNHIQQEKQLHSRIPSLEC